MKYKNLVEAAYWGTPTDIQEHLLNNADVNETQDIYIRNSSRFSSMACGCNFSDISITPLHAAVMARNIDNVRLLLANGADSYKSVTSYYRYEDHQWFKADANELAQKQGLFDFVVLFAVTRLQNNMVVDMQKLTKPLARHPKCFTAQQYEELIAAMPIAELNKFLWALIPHNVLLPVTIALRKGADPNTVDNDGNTALHLALRRNKADLNTIKQLLASGADPNAVDNEGNTVLHLALLKSSIDINLIKTICAYGADKHAKNKGQQTPLDLCKNPLMRERLLAMPSTLPPTAQVIEDEMQTVSNASCSCFGFLWARARSAANQPTVTNRETVVEAKLALA